jgi:hypothetical protein
MPTNNMVFSPMQRDQVTREEFGEFREEVNSNFDEMKVRFDDEKEFVRDGFDGLGKQIDFVESNLGKKIDLIAGNVSWLKRSITKVMKNMGVS